jgi:Ca2+-binding EF-hand superfamily protein
MEANMARSNEKSHQIIETIKRKKIIEIFKLLDSDGDGYISSTKIDIASVGTDILEAFAPLLCEMEELNQTLSLEDFLEAADKLLRVKTKLIP